MLSAAVPPIVAEMPELNPVPVTLTYPPPTSANPAARTLRLRRQATPQLLQLAVPPAATPPDNRRRRGLPPLTRPATLRQLARRTTRMATTA